MSQSLAKNYIHIVFTTKNRQKWIHAEIEKGLFNHLSEQAKRMDSTALKIGGSDDHVHLLVCLSKNTSLSFYLANIKAFSSRWMKSQHPEMSKFVWQNGYGAFSVDVTRLDQIIGYISKQREHHKVVTFQEEFRKLLVDHRVDFDERYLWD